jgi:hypothetical protein
MTTHEPPKLCLVPNYDDLAFEFLPAPPRPKTEQPARARVRRSDKLFAAVPLDWLTDRRWDRNIPAKFRLYLYLWIKTHRGQREVSLTNAMAADIGLVRQDKARWLAVLEKQGQICVNRQGRETLVITLVPGAGHPNP